MAIPQPRCHSFATPDNAVMIPEGYHKAPISRIRISIVLCIEPYLFNFQARLMKRIPMQFRVTGFCSTEEVLLVRGKKRVTV